MVLLRPFVAMAMAAAGTLAQRDDEMKGVYLRTHSIAAPFLDGEMTNRWWDFGGDAIIRADSYVRLVPDHPSHSGYLFSRVPLTATNWEIEIEFKIHGKNHLYGDGMAIWITKNRAEMGPVFGSKDQFEGLGIFIDTYKNNRPGTVFPYVMAMMGDGNTQYDRQSDGKANEIAGCSARGLRNPVDTTKIRMTYYQDKNVTVHLQFKEDGDWTHCFDVPNPKIPSVAYLGFSAETGELSDNHDIISVQTNNLYEAKTNKKGDSGKKSKAEKQKERERNRKASKKALGSGGSWTWFFLKIILFILAAGGAYVGFTFYRAQKQSSRF